MAQTAGDVLVQTPIDWGVDTIFAIPGDGLPLLGKNDSRAFLDDAQKGRRDWREPMTDRGTRRGPEYGCKLEPIGFTKLTEACGIPAVRIDDPARRGEQFRGALLREGPCLIEAVVDPNEPPMPPKIEVKPALRFARSRVRGTSNARKISLTVALNTVRELV